LEQALNVALRTEAYLRTYINDRVRETHNRKERKVDHWAEGQYNFAVRRTGQPAESNNDDAIICLRQELDSLRREVDLANKERYIYKLLVEQRRSDDGVGSRPNSLPLVATNSPGKRRENALRERRYFNCNQPGHFRTECHWLSGERDKPSQPAVTDDGRTDASTHTSVATDDTQPKIIKGITSRQTDMPTYLSARIGRRDVVYLLDTGSEVCLFVTEVVCGFESEPAKQRLCAADGKMISIPGRVCIPVNVASETFMVSGLVSDHAHEIVLEINFLTENTALWDFSRGLLNLRGKSFELNKFGAKSWCRRLVIAESTEVPPKSEAIFNGYVVFNGIIVGPPAENEAWRPNPLSLTMESTSPA
jgi:hypothetical protein